MKLANNFLQNMNEVITKKFENLKIYQNSLIAYVQSEFKKKKELLNFISHFLFICKYKIIIYDSSFMFNQIG